MSPTSYRAAPPRNSMITSAGDAVKLLMFYREGCRGIDESHRSSCSNSSANLQRDALPSVAVSIAPTHAVTEYGPAWCFEI